MWKRGGGTRAQRRLAEGVRGHVREGGASARGCLEVDPNAVVRQGLDRVVGEGRAEQVATDPLESSAVAAVDGRGRVQVQLVGGDRVRWRLGVGHDGGEMRASQRVLDASRERGVEVEVEVVGVMTHGGEDLVHSAEDGGGHPLGGRRRRGPEGEVVRALLERAVDHKQVEVDVEAEVAAEALNHGDDPAVERRDRGESVLTLDRAPDVLKDCLGEAA